MELKFGIIPIYSETFDLCKILEDGGISCPVASGSHTATVTETVPAAVPSVSSAPVCVGLLLIGSGGDNWTIISKRLQLLQPRG